MNKKQNEIRDEKLNGWERKKREKKGGKGGEERPKNSARPSRTHNNNTLSSAHATAATLQGRRRTRHTHKFFPFFFFISFGREIFFFSGRSFIFMWFDSAHSPARARARSSNAHQRMGGWVVCLPYAGVFTSFIFIFFFLADRIGSPNRIPSIIFSFSYYYYYLFTKHLLSLLLSLFFFLLLLFGFLISFVSVSLSWSTPSYPISPSIFFFSPKIALSRTLRF